MWLRKVRSRERNVKIQVEEIASVKDQDVGIGMFRAVLMLTKNVDVFMKTMHLKDIK